MRVFTYRHLAGRLSEPPRSTTPPTNYVDAATYLDADQKKAIREWTGDGIMRIGIGLEERRGPRR